MDEKFSQRLNEKKEEWQSLAVCPTCGHVLYGNGLFGEATYKIEPAQGIVVVPVGYELLHAGNGHVVKWNGRKV